MKFSHTAIARKSYTLLRRPQRVIRRIAEKTATANDCRGILCNSFPKSGTHLLLQVLQSLPQTYFYGSFLASVPSLTFKLRSERNQEKRLAAVAPDEVMPAHLYHSERVALQIKKQSLSHFFIYRDLRDVVVSEAHYLSTMAWWHRLSHYYRGCDDLESRLLLSIEGLPNQFANEYPDIGTRFKFYKPWISSEHCCAIRYEDLRGPNLEQNLRRIASFDLRMRGIPFDADRFVTAAVKAIDPASSHTFRSGKKGGWKDCFTPKVQAAFDRVASDVISELNYDH